MLKVIILNKMLYEVLHTFTTATHRYYKYESICIGDISESDLNYALAKRWIRKVI